MLTAMPKLVLFEHFVQGTCSENASGDMVLHASRVAGPLQVCKPYYIVYNKHLLLYTERRTRYDT